MPDDCGFHPLIATLPQMAQERAMRVEITPTLGGLPTTGRSRQRRTIPSGPVHRRGGPPALAASRPPPPARPPPPMGLENAEEGIAPYRQAGASASYREPIAPQGPGVDRPTLAGLGRPAA